ncbi:DoxX family protein [Actinopolymorpha alba]|uniref:DoxX family protein n=1 Tax=Actinopolymorpha alba TaxID=533267 RepID=UPI0003667039|nr:DoxX family protein [Actinopolymorpha alba]
MKEWAYAGAFFNFSGAVISHLASGSEWYHVGYTFLFTLCTLTSWALRPSNRVLGNLYPHPGRHQSPDAIQQTDTSEHASAAHRIG